MGRLLVEVGFHAKFPGDVTVILISLHTGEVQGSIPCVLTMLRQLRLTSQRGSVQMKRAEACHGVARAKRERRRATWRASPTAGAIFVEIGLIRQDRN